MSRPIPDCALQFLPKAEGCKLVAYRDSAGVWTIGWGHTGPEVVEGLVITLAQALFYLRLDAAHAVRRLELVLTEAAIAALSEHQYAALISFVFNLGVGDLPPKLLWEIWRDIRAGRLDQVTTQMMRFDKIRDPATRQLEEVPGLVHRRTAEVVLWKSADVAAAAAVIAAAPVQAPPSSVTRLADTPPTPSSPKPLQATSLGVKIGGAAVAIGAGVANLQGSAEQVKGVLAPYVAHVHQLETVAAALTAVIVACSIAQILIHAFQTKSAAL